MIFFLFCLDDEDICSVSSINGNLSEHNSLSLAREQLVKQPITSLSVDPNLDQRPVTRFGKPNRSAVFGRQTSTGSPEFSNTAATSLWGTYSKGMI